MFIRTREEALQAVADLLDLTDLPQQLLQSTVLILSCLDVEPRRILAEAQALLIADGIDGRRRRRRAFLQRLEAPPVLLENPEDDRLFHAAASSLDALELCGLIRDVFPGLRAERWQLARVLLEGEAEVRDRLVSALRGRGRTERIRVERLALETLLAGRRPGWADRAGTLRAACLNVLRGSGLSADETLHEDAERLFEIVAVSDDQADALLSALDGRRPDAAARQIVRLHETVEAVLSLPEVPPADASQAA